MVCPQCHQNDEIFINGCCVCDNCGYVLDEQIIRIDVETQQIGNETAPVGVRVSNSGIDPSARNIPEHFSSHLKSTLNQQDQAKKKLYYTSQRIASQLGIPTSEQIMHLATQAMRNKIKTGRKAELIVASCAYIYSRRTQRPISLLDVALAVEENVFKLGQIYTTVVAALQINLENVDPALFIDKTCSEIPQVNDLPVPQKSEIMTRAVQLINLAKGEWLATGRKPTPITAAALCLAMESFEFRPDSKSIANLLKIGLSTYKTRYNELKNTLIDIAKKILPWGNNVNKKNVASHINDIFVQLNFLARTSNSTIIPLNLNDSDSDQGNNTLYDKVTIPPCVAKHQQRQQKVQQKIGQAKSRISKLMYNAPLRKIFTELNPIFVQEELLAERPNQALTAFEDLDEEDLIIEKLLLSGHSEENIINMNGDYTKHEQSMNTNHAKHDLESTELTEQDIPDSQIFDFIKSPSEVAALSQITPHTEPTQPSSKSKKIKPKSKINRQAMEALVVEQPTTPKAWYMDALDNLFADEETPIEDQDDHDIEDIPGSQAPTPQTKKQKIH